MLSLDAAAYHKVWIPRRVAVFFTFCVHANVRVLLVVYFTFFVDARTVGVCDCVCSLCINAKVKINQTATTKETFVENSRQNNVHTRTRTRFHYYSQLDADRFSNVWQISHCFYVVVAVFFGRFLRLFFIVSRFARTFRLLLCALRIYLSLGTIFFSSSSSSSSSCLSSVHRVHFILFSVYFVFPRQSFGRLGHAASPWTWRRGRKKE